ncbi:hypothetical protein [Flectobacillus roseus]|uniref:hypothetical protein n=1 Tax=Flectobacillus roseus TaxID=502259 RepID=UPI0024B6DA13|nr:hypothetical protein [Flectobacillus roseus]MDI9872115.1 hypothetical protein [Flectobacillus roseus]
MAKQNQKNQIQQDETKIVDTTEKAEVTITRGKTPAEKAKERLERRQQEEDEKVAEIARKKAEEEKKKSGQEEEETESEEQ